MEKTKLELLTICDYALISQDNKLSIIGTFDQMFVTIFPSQYPQFYVVGIVSGTAGKIENIALEIKTPSNKNAIPPQSTNLTIGPNGKANILINIGNLPIPEAGFYKIRLVNGDGILGEKEFVVFEANKQNIAKESSNKYSN
jgi:uncharacterized membrane protein